MKKIVFALLVLLICVKAYTQELNKTYIFYMKNGEAIRGIVIEKNDKNINLKTLKNEDLTIEIAEIEDFKEYDIKIEEKKSIKINDKGKIKSNPLKLSFSLQYAYNDLMVNYIGPQYNYFGQNHHNIYFDALGNFELKNIGINNKYFEHLLLGFGVGCSYYHYFNGESILTPDIVIIPLYLNFAYNYNLNDIFSVKPSISIGYDFKLFDQIEKTLTGYFFKPQIDINFNLNNNNSIGVIIGYYMNNIEYSYNYQPLKYPNYIQTGLVFTFN